ncbi:MAG: carboxypeptidase-like regulatory domain-containing protein, partial [bacterium]
MTPAELGQVEGIIAVSGYDLYTEAFDIIEAFGTMTGTVSSGGTPLAGVTVYGYDDTKALAFTAVTNASGAYDVGEDILVASYQIEVDFFGYLPYVDDFFVNYGANVNDIVLLPAPSGVLSGTVTEIGTGLPLAAAVKVYRIDTGELYTETATNPVDGSYATAALPYFDYRVTVKAWHYIPVTIELTMEEPIVEKHFILEPTIGDLLLISDDGKAGFVEAKYGADGSFLAPGYEVAGHKAAADMMTDLEDLGYTVTLETMTASDPVTWVNYDLIMVASGDNTTTLNDAGFRADLEAFVLGGGHLLIEGGEVGYDHYGSGSFAENVLHTTDWNHDQSGNITIAEPTHYVMTVPNVLTGPMAMTYAGYGDQDANVPTADAVMIGSWTDYPTDASIITYDPNPAPEGGQIVFFLFNYSALDTGCRASLLQNTVTWLMAQEAGDCAVSGVATLQGETDHSGIRVEAVPNGGYVMTGPDGSYTLPGLFAGTYSIIATKDGYRTDKTSVTLSGGQHQTGVDLQLGAPGSVSGVATLEGESDHSGIHVEALPGGVSFDTGPTGEYTLDGLIAGTYTVRATKLGWAPATTVVTLVDNEHLVGVDLLLTATSGSFLIVDDGTASGVVPPREDEKTGEVLAEGYQRPNTKSASDIAAVLEGLGYAVVVENAAATDPASWLGYDLLVF